MNYYLRIKGKSFGPFDENRLIVMKAKGNIFKNTELSSDCVNWFPAETLNFLFPPPVPKAAQQPTATGYAVSPEPAIWFYSTDGNTGYGPITQNVVVQMIQNGTLKPDSSVWQEGGTAQSIKTVSTFAGYFGKTGDSLSLTMNRKSDYTSAWSLIITGTSITAILLVVICVYFLSTSGFVTEEESDMNTKELEPKPPVPVMVATQEASQQVSEAEKRISKALEKNMDIDIDENTTFEDLFNMIKDKNPGINIDIDQSAGELGISTSSPIVREPKKYTEIKLQSILRLILSEQDLTYCIKNDVILITAAEEESDMNTKELEPKPPVPVMVATQEASQQVSEAEKRISKALEKNMDIDIDENTTFEDLFNMIKDKNPGINIDIDRSAGELGITTSTPVVRESKKYTGIKLQNILRLILSEQDLTYCIKNEIILITAAEE